MLPVDVSRAALASNLVRELKNLAFPIRRKRNLPPRIGILQDTVGHWTSKRVLDQNVIRLSYSLIQLILPDPALPQDRLVISWTT
jgi:hypothetical protein